MRALVTGATGKVGHATARALISAGYEVRALVRDPQRSADGLPAGVEAVRGDVTNPRIVAARRGRLRSGVQRDGFAGAVAGGRIGV
jgi:dihydroflavonol-4-reductase